MRAVHWSEVKPKKRVTPKFPKSASQLGLEASCQIVFFIDEKGKPDGNATVPTIGDTGKPNEIAIVDGFSIVEKEATDHGLKGFQ